MTSCNSELQVVSETWNKDSIDLIDYESNSLIQQSHTFNEPFFVYFYNNELTFSKTSIPSNKQLFQIGVKGTNYYLQTNKYERDLKAQTEKGTSAWFVYKSSKCPEKGKSYLLNEGDIIKIGRITLIVKKIKLSRKQSIVISHSNSLSSNNNNNNNNMINIGENDNKKEQQQLQLKTDIKYMQSSLKLSTNNPKSKRTCRICYSEDNTDESPLIQPCQCSGSMKYIHLACLRKWIETTLCIKVYSNEHYAQYSLKNIECELCKAKFPDMIRHNGKLYELTSFHSDYDKYMILEGLTLDKNNTKSLYVISFDHYKKKINIGRGHDSHLLLNDISVSRIHCLVYQDGRNVYIEDNDSKFGTLVLIQNQMLTLYSSVPLHFQVGRTYFGIKIKEPFSLFNCCNVSTKVDEKEYQRQNSLKISLEHSHTVNVKEEEFNGDDDDDSENDVDEDAKVINKETNKNEIIKMNSSISDSDNTVNNDNQGIVLTNVRHQDTIDVDNNNNNNNNK